MQERVITKEAKAYQKSAWAIRVVFLLAGLMIVGGGIWYAAITGIIGRKKWKKINQYLILVCFLVQYIQGYLSLD